MIWRPAYRTQIAHGVRLPTLDRRTDILIGGFDMAALRDMSIWRRLADADAANSRYLEAIFLPDPQPADLALLETIIPPSHLSSTALIADTEGAWRDLIQPSSNAECFAAVIRHKSAPIVMKGIPTEEAWDAFLEALRT